MNYSSFDKRWESLHGDKKRIYAREDGNVPAIPLPNPGEGGPVYDGETQQPQMPVIPLPNPGEGGPVFDGNNNDDNDPIIPLPNPGEGGPVFPGPIITVPVRPVLPCFFCNATSNGSVRFLNAAFGYGAFTISISNNVVVRNLEYAEISDYGRVSTGYQTVSIAAGNGYIYVSKQIRVKVGSKVTIAVVNVAGGLDFTVIDDETCNTPLGGSCLRACNLSYNSGPLNVFTTSDNLIFGDVEFLEVTNYRRVLPGTYVINVANSQEFLITTEVTTRSNSQYTIYIFNWEADPTALRTLIIEDRK